MATPSPLNWNQRGKAASPRGFTTAEDYASHHAALNSGPTGMHEKNTIQSGPHKGKTPDQVYAYYLDEGASKGYQRRSPENAARLTLGLPEQKPGIDDGMTRTASNTSTGAGGSTPTTPPLKSPSPSMRGKGVAGVKVAQAMAAGPYKPIATAKTPAATLPNQVSFGWGANYKPTPAAPPAPTTPPVAANPSNDAALAAQGIAMQTAGIQQRGTNGSVQFADKGGYISPTRPDGSRSLTSGYGTGSVSPIAASPRVKKFDGMSPEQFGRAAAVRQGQPNAFTNYQTPAASPAVPAMGPAQQRLADFTASNPPTLTDKQIDQKQQTFQANRDNLAAIQAQKAIAAGPPRAVSPGSPPLANAAGQAGNLLTKLTEPKPSLAPLLSSPTTPPLRAGVAATPPASLSSRSKSAITAAVAASPKPQPIPDEYYRSLPMEGVKGAANLAKGAFNAVSHVGEKIAEQFDTSFIHTPPPLLARKPAPVGTGPFVSLPPGMGARAEGGPVQGGKPYLVGERGPEIVVPAQNGTVIPNKAISPSRLGRDKAMAYPPAGYPDHGLAPAAGQVRHRPMATNNDWRSPTRPVKASRPSLLASR